MRVERIVEQIDELIPMPYVITKLMELLNNPEISANEIASVISLDEAISTKLLKVVNSAYFGVKNPISNIQRAIVILGFQNVKNLAIGVSLVSSGIDFPSKHINRIDFWKHQLATAAFAQQLMQIHGFKLSIDEVFLASFLHDIGKLALIHFLGGQYDTVIQMSKEQNEPSFRIERNLYSFDHQKVGHELCKKWNFPKIISEAISRHHKPLALYANPVSIQDRLEFSMITANILANICGLGTSGNFAINLESLSLDIIDKIAIQTLDNVSKIYYDTVKLFDLQSTLILPTHNTFVLISLLDKKFSKIIEMILKMNLFNTITEADIAKLQNRNFRLLFIHDDITQNKIKSFTDQNINLKPIPINRWKDKNPEQNLNPPKLIQWLYAEISR
ncbi:MAG: HDOD domain-containing protein [Planctomycetes bacterium]|nr:HDOD domain-containing protein [Planctomycetota bacterium]